jgi:hypothetical protein
MSFGHIIDVLWGIFLIAGCVVAILWCVTMNRAIDQVSHDIRKMEPGAVWLCMIPLFGFVWGFMVNNAVADGVAKELQIRGIFPNEQKPGYSLGLTGSILICFCIIPYGGIGIALIGLVFLILHIVKISEYNKVLQQSGRWEYRYHERMNALRQQQQAQWPAMQQGYQQPMYPSQQPYNPPPPAMPPPGYYNPDTLNTSPDQKEKPKNPFG